MNCQKVSIYEAPDRLCKFYIDTFLLKSDKVAFSILI